MFKKSFFSFYIKIFQGHKSKNYLATFITEVNEVYQKAKIQNVFFQGSKACEKRRRRRKKKTEKKEI